MGLYGLWTGCSFHGSLVGGWRSLAEFNQGHCRQASNGAHGQGSRGWGAGGQWGTGSGQDWIGDLWLHWRRVLPVNGDASPAGNRALLAMTQGSHVHYSEACSIFFKVSQDLSRVNAADWPSLCPTGTHRQQQKTKAICLRRGSAGLTAGWEPR